MPLSQVPIHTRILYRWPVISKFMWIKLEFDENVEELKSSMDILNRVFDQLMCCEALAGLLHVVLMVGNIINGVSCFSAMNHLNL